MNRKIGLLLASQRVGAIPPRRPEPDRSFSQRIPWYIFTNLLHNAELILAHENSSALQEPGRTSSGGPGPRSRLQHHERADLNVCFQKKLK